MHRVDEVAHAYDAARSRADYDTLAVIAGEAVGLVHEVASARDIVQRVVDEAAALLRGVTRLVDTAAALAGAPVRRRASAPP